MTFTHVDVVGAKELRRALRRANNDLDKTALKKAHRTSAEIVARTATQIVPVRSGKLQATIRASGTQTKGIVRAGFARVPYAGVIHFGWPGHNISPQPFLYDAADARVGEVVNTYLKQVNDIIDRIAAEAL